jgi:transposase
MAIMAKGYSTDLRDRVVALVEASESRREAARLLDLAASTTIRWMDRWHTTGSVAAKPGTGHCRSPLEQHEQWLLDLEQIPPDAGQRLARMAKIVGALVEVCTINTSGSSLRHSQARF